MSSVEHPSALYPADNSAVTAHINLLQGIINRLATNSASCKTWCVTLIAALLSLAGATKTPAIVHIVLVPMTACFFMDTMYLAQERAYRDLYKAVVSKVRDGTYARTDLFEAGAPLDFMNWLACVASWSIFPLYGGLMVTYLVADLAGWLSSVAPPATGNR